MAGVERSFTGLGDTRIVYDVWEPVGDPLGLILVSHGLGEHGGRYRHVAERLAGLGLRVVVPDHRGHGRSEGRRLFLRQVSDFSDDLETLRVRERVEGQPTYLLGHSMGGCIALDYALDHQSELAGLIVSGAAVVPGEDLSPVMVRIAKVLGRVAPKAPTMALDSAWVSKDPAVVAAYDADPLVFHGKVPAGIAGAMLRTMAGFAARLPSLRIPLLVLHGAEDKLVNPEGSRLVDKLAGSPDKTLKIYPGLFHEIFNEPEQDLVLDDVTSWLKAHLPA